MVSSPQRGVNLLHQLSQTQLKSYQVPGIWYWFDGNMILEENPVS